MNVSHKLSMLIIGLIVVLSAAGCTESGTKERKQEAVGVPTPVVTAPVESNIQETSQEKEGLYFEGMVASKRAGGEGGMVLVIENLSMEIAANYSWDELVRYSREHDSGIYYYVSSEQYRQLEVGQLVGISSTQEESSNPPYRNTKDIKILKEAEPAHNTGYRDDVVTGHIRSIDLKKLTISLDISDWVNLNNHGPIEDIGHGIDVPFNEDTKLVDGLGQTIKFSTLKVGDKLEMIPAEEWSYEQGNKQPFLTESITRMMMTRTEKLERFLANPGKIHTVVFFQEGADSTHDEMDFGRYVPGAYIGGISWVPYYEGEAVDYKEELSLVELPAIVVFDEQDAIYKTNSIRELQKWFNERAAAVR